MESGPYLIMVLLVFLGLGALGFSIFSMIREARFLRQIATELGISVSTMHWIFRHGVTGDYNGHRASFMTHSQRNRFNHRISLNLDIGLRGRFLIRNRPTRWERWLNGGQSSPFDISYGPPKLLLSESLVGSDIDVYADRNLEPLLVRLFQSSSAAMNMVKNPDMQIYLDDGELTVTEMVAWDKRTQIRVLWNALIDSAAGLGVTIQFISRSDDEQAVCPFCKDEILRDQNTIRCSECKAIHHDGCWTDNGRCSVFGCNGTPMRTTVSS